MKHLVEWRRLRIVAAALVLVAGCAAAGAQTAAPPPAAPATQVPDATIKAPPVVQPAPAAPDTKPAPTPVPPATPPSAAPLAPPGAPTPTEIEPSNSPSTPQKTTTETVDVPARSIATLAGSSSYDDAFKSVKTALETVKAAIDKAGLKQAGHPITIVRSTDDKGFKFEAAIPIAATPDGKPDLGSGVTLGRTPSGKAMKFQHRGAYDDIDETYNVIISYLDEKGLQVDSPYIEEYLTDLTTADDPNLQVDIYVFMK